MRKLQNDASLFILSLFSIVICLCRKQEEERKVDDSSHDMSGRTWPINIDGWFIGSSCRIITVQIYGGASFWRMTLLLCAGLMPSWWPSRAAAARSKWWADPPSECIRVTPLSGMIIVFFFYYFSSFGSFLIRLLFVFFFSCVSIFRPRYPYLDKKYIQYVAPCFDGDIVADLCAPHTHTQFISAPNWAYKYPLFPRFLSILVVVISLRMRVQLVSGHSIGQRFYAFTSYAYEERRDHKMSLLLWGLCRPAISRLYIISQDLFFKKKRSFFILLLLFYFDFNFLPFFVFVFVVVFFRLRSVLHSLGLLSVACSTLNYSRGLVVAAGDGGGGGGPFSGFEYFFLFSPFFFFVFLSLLSTKSHTKMLSGWRRRRRRRTERRIVGRRKKRRGERRGKKREMDSMLVKCFF